MQSGAETAFAVSVVADDYGQKGDLEGLDKLEMERLEKAADLLIPAVNEKQKKGGEIPPFFFHDWILDLIQTH